MEWSWVYRGLAAAAHTHSSMCTGQNHSEFMHTHSHLNNFFIPTFSQRSGSAIIEDGSERLTALSHVMEVEGESKKTSEQ